MPNQIAPRMERRGNSGLNRLAEIVEPAITVGTNLLAEIPAYASGMIEARDTGSPAAGVRRAEEVSEMLTYNPRTMEGQAGLQSLTNSVMRVMDAVGIDEAVNYVNNTIMPNLQRTFGERAASEIGSTLLMAIPMARKVPGIRAFHGSPHDFDEFSMDAIGTGEGAQAYGHGLYFADSEDVARGYRDALSRNKSITIDGETVSAASFPFGSPERQAIASFDGDAATTAKSLREYATQIDDSETYIKAAEWLESKGDALRPGGHMYQVDIDASPDELLDWDAPLSRQPERVKKSLGLLPDSKLRERLAGKTNVGTELFGSDIYDEIQSYFSPQRSNIFDGGTATEGMADASDELRELGIKGIRYKDGFSRGKDGGSYNYVIFDDRLINISKKYGIAIPAAAVLLGQETGQDPSSLYEEDFSA